MICQACQQKMVAYQYINHKGKRRKRQMEYYEYIDSVDAASEGICEWECDKCDVRIGQFSKNKLERGEFDIAPFSNDVHPHQRKNNLYKKPSFWKRLYTAFGRFLRRLINR